MTTTILSIATLLIGVVAGMAFYHYVITDYLRQSRKKQQRKHIMMSERLAELSASNLFMRKENESLRFQIEQYNIAKDAMKFTEQE